MGSAVVGLSVGLTDGFSVGDSDVGLSVGSAVVGLSVFFGFFVFTAVGL